MKELLEILSYKRGYSTDSELLFINYWLIPRLSKFNPVVDEVGNIIVRNSTTTNVLWSCHTDSVHHTVGPPNATCD